MVSSAGGLKQISGATMSQAGLSQLSGGGPGGVKMVVVSSGQLAQAQNTKPITISMPGSQKTVTLSGQKTFQSFELESTWFYKLLSFFNQTSILLNYSGI